MSTFNLGDPPNPPKKKPLNLSAPSPKETQPEPTSSPSIDPTPTNSGTSDALPDFDNAPLPDDETAAAIEVGEGAEGKITPSGLWEYEVFDKGFCTSFSLVGHATGFKTLVDAPNIPTRPDATRAMYDIILDTPSLHFLLSPQSLWMQRAVTLAAFFVPVASGVAGEMRERRAPKAQAQKTAGKSREDEQAEMLRTLKGK